MAEFKSMPKMCTSESSQVLKLAKGGSTSKTTKMASTNLTTGYQMYKDGGKVMKAEGGAMGALSDMAAIKMADKRKAKKAPTAAMEDKYPPKPGRPMPSKKPMTAPTTFMKDGGEVMMMDKKVHKHEGAMHPGKPLTKLKTGGVTSGAKNDSKACYKDGGEVAKKAMGGRMMGQKPAQTIRTAPIGSSQATRDMFASMGKKPAYKDGGAIGSANKSHARGVSSMPGGSFPAATKATLNGNDAAYAKTKVNTHSRSTSSTLKDYGDTGDVAKTRPGGYKDGGKVKEFAFGGPADQPSMQKKDGGVMKKAYADGGKVTMSAEKMPEGKKAPSAPVRINQLAGTFKNGGKVEC